MTQKTIDDEIERLNNSDSAGVIDSKAFLECIETQLKERGMVIEEYPMLWTIRNTVLNLRYVDAKFFTNCIIELIKNNSYLTNQLKDKNALYVAKASELEKKDLDLRPPLTEGTEKTLVKPVVTTDRPEISPPSQKQFVESLTPIILKSDEDIDNLYHEWAVNISNDSWYDFLKAKLYGKAK